MSRPPSVRARALGLALASTLLLAPGTGLHAEPKPASASSSDSDADRNREVKELMRAGIAQYRNGNLDEARAQFARAWKIKPTVELAASLAEVEMKLQRYDEAAAHWEFYIQNLPPDRSDAEYQLAECRKHLGSVRVAVDTPGAIVSLDGDVLGPAPLRVDVWVSPGSHVFAARVQDKTPVSQQIAIASGEAQMVTLMLAGSSSSEQPASVEDAPAGEPARADVGKAGGSGKTIAILTGSGLALVAVGVGVGFTLKANTASDDADDLRNEIAAVGDPSLAPNHAYCSPPAGQRPPQCDAYAKKLEEQGDARTIAIASFVTGGVFALGTLVTALVWPEASAGSATAPRFDFTAGARGTSFSVSGAF